jgi:hypothetical protein
MILSNKPFKVNCRNKRRYNTEIEARAGALSVIELRHNDMKLYVYKCAVCGGWHMTRKPNKLPHVGFGNPYIGDLK